MKIYGRHIALSLFVALSSFASNSYAAIPLPMTKKSSDSMTVTGSRIVLQPVTANDLPGQFLDAARPGLSSGSTTATPATVNATSKAKGKRSKGSPFWKSIVSFVGAADIKGFILDIVKTDISITKAKGTKTFRDGQLIQETIECTEIAVNSQNLDTCGRLLIGPGANGTKLIEFQKLINYNGKLVYSTEDTLTFSVASGEELFSILNEIDPTAGI